MDKIPTLGELLAERGFPLDAAALLAAVDTSTMCRLRNGKVRPRATTLIRLAQGLGISVTRMRKIIDQTMAEASAAARSDG